MRVRRALAPLLAVAGLAAGVLAGAGAGASAGTRLVCPQPLVAGAAAMVTPTVTLPCSPCPPVHVTDAAPQPVCTTPCATNVCTIPTPTVPVPIARTCVIASSPRVRRGVFDVTCHGSAGVRFRAWAKVRKHTLGRGHRTARASGRAVVRVRLTRAGRHALAGAADGLRVRVIVHDRSGATILNRVVRLRG